MEIYLFKLRVQLSANVLNFVLIEYRATSACMYQVSCYVFFYDLLFACLCSVGKTQQSPVVSGLFMLVLQWSLTQIFLNVCMPLDMLFISNCLHLCACTEYIVFCCACCSDVDLYEHFLLEGVALVCEPENPTTSTHISYLPYEVLQLIFRWVVAAHLDVRSLEQLSQVSVEMFFLPCSCKSGICLPLRI